MCEELTDKQKLEIQAYLSKLLSKWLSWLGIVNFSALAAAFIYIFFILPDKAISVAVSASSVKLDAQIQRLEKEIPQLDHRLGRLSKSLDDTQETTDSIKNKIGMMKSEITSVKLQLDQLKAMPVYQVVEAIAALNQADTAKEILGKLSTVHNTLGTLSQKLELQEATTKQQGKDYKVQSGTINMKAQGTRPLNDNSRCPNGPDSSRGIMNGHQSFPEPFSKKPEVILAIAYADVSGGFRLSTHVTNITKEGFDYTFVTWCDTIITSAYATWLAVSVP